MAKKTKIGKQRKDKYYQLAKETGYRSRAAFKLIQLNRKFGFLQKSRVCIDLCAAPGGWMQVAHQNMPLSSIVIGVDLFPIKTVPGCISLTEDITTEKCKTAISKELKTWKADVVLNDGAPNVGLNWLHDAYQQVSLTLSALKLATNFLKEGGWFVTKVFRSKDYHPLLWVFKQLFKKVHATKPQASRNESSEIFVVCQHYIAPDLIDAKFLDPKYVFEEFELETKSKFNILHPEKQKKAKAEGYRENDYTQHAQVSVSEFLLKEDPVDLLRGCSEIVIDDETVKSHPRTTPEITECCKDIKVLGRKDLKLLLSWLKAVKASRPETAPIEEVSVKPQKSDQSEDDDKNEENEVDAKILELQDEERRDSKRKRKLLNKQRQKLAERMNLKMVLKGDGGPVLESDDMFKLQDIKNVNQLQKMTDQLPEVTAVSDEESEDEMKLKPKYMKYNTEDSHLHNSGSYYKDSDSELEIESDSETDDKDSLGFSDSEEDNVKKLTKLNTKKNSKTPKISTKGHPLLNDLDDRDEKTVRSRRAENWFNKDSFKEFDEDEDEDMDLDKLAHTYKKKGKKISDKALVKHKVVSTKQKASAKSVDSGVDSDDTDDETSDSDYDVETKINPKVAKKGTTVSGDTFDVVPQDPELKRLKKSLVMDEEALSLGTMLATSRKFKRDLIDDSWNRYMFADKNLPDWFVEDEAKNMKKPVIVPEKYADEYKNRLQEINVRPIKKVMEAKARKKKRMLKKMERAKKKVESVMENADMSEREKARQVKQLYKKASTERKKEVTYVVARKHTTSKRMKKPAGVKGRYRVVDPRQKKDLRATKAHDKKNKKFKPGKRNKKGNKAK